MGAGGRTTSRSSKAEVVKARLAQRQKDSLAKADDDAYGPVRLSSNAASSGVEFDHWASLHKRQCVLCSRKPVEVTCSKCHVETCGLCAARQTVVPYRWICVECACTSDDSGEQARTLVACQNEDLHKRVIVLANTDAEVPDELASVIAERVLADKDRHLEIGRWAEVKRRDWEPFMERPVMPMGQGGQQTNPGGAGFGEFWGQKATPRTRRPRRFLLRQHGETGE